MRSINIEMCTRGEDGRGGGDQTPAGYCLNSDDNRLVTGTGHKFKGYYHILPSVGVYGSSKSNQKAYDHI